MRILNYLLSWKQLCLTWDVPGRLGMAPGCPELGHVAILLIRTDRTANYLFNSKVGSPDSQAWCV